MNHLDHNSLYYGDCLEVLASWPADCVDLCYLDPPFNSNVNYNVLFGSDKATGRQAQVTAFSDTWDWDEAAVDRVMRLKNASAHIDRQQCMIGLHSILGDSGMLAYLAYMAERLTEIKRVVKPTGSVYLHCDPNASHYLKVVMDAIFAGKNFIDEIVWNYGTPSGGRVSGKKPVKTHDIILAYALDYGHHTYNKVYTSYSEKYIRNWFRHTETDETSGKKRRYQTRSRSGKIIRQYLDESPGVPLSNVWSDIKQLYGSAGWFPKTKAREEITGYPTQKPVELLQRIIKMASNPGELVLDPFCGCGTTVVAADGIGRDWVGIDISPFAVDLMMHRLGEGRNITAYGMPADLESAGRLAREHPFEFEKWAISRVDGLIPNQRQRGDEGVDGRGTLAIAPQQDSTNLVIAQVKGGKPSKSQFRDFLHAVERDNAAFGLFITLEPVPESWRPEARKAGSLQIGASRFPRVQCWSLRDHFDGTPPDLPILNDPYTGTRLARQRTLALGRS